MVRVILAILFACAVLIVGPRASIQAQDLGNGGTCLSHLDNCSDNPWGTGNNGTQFYNDIFNTMNTGGCFTAFQDQCEGGMSPEACRASCEVAYNLDVSWCNGFYSPQERAICFAQAAERFGSCLASCG